jgi:hypothetical protein
MSDTRSCCHVQGRMGSTKRKAMGSAHTTTGRALASRPCVLAMAGSTFLTDLLADCDLQGPHYVRLPRPGTCYLARIWAANCVSF